MLHSAACLPKRSTGLIQIWRPSTSRKRNSSIAIRCYYHRLPEAYAIYGYEAAKVGIDAIHRANKKDRAAIVAACLATKDFHGALGTWSFDENGDTTLKRLSGNIVHDGKFKFVKLLGD